MPVPVPSIAALHPRDMREERWLNRLYFTNPDGALRSFELLHGRAGTT